MRPQGLTSEVFAAFTTPPTTNPGPKPSRAKGLLAFLNAESAFVKECAKKQEVDALPTQLQETQAPTPAAVPTQQASYFERLRAVVNDLFH